MDNDMMLGRAVTGANAKPDVDYMSITTDEYKELVYDHVKLLTLRTIVDANSEHGKDKYIDASLICRILGIYCMDSGKENDDAGDFS